MSNATRRSRATIPGVAAAQIAAGRRCDRRPAPSRARCGARPRRALGAAHEAGRRLGELSANRGALGQEPLDYGLALHLREVLYGNIGVADRLELSVIGAAANEAARLESLTKRLETRTPLSDDFVSALPVQCTSRGRYELRGVGQPVEVYVP